MSKTGFELNRSGVRQLMQSDEMMTICKDYAYKAQSRLGKEYTVSYITGKNRVNAEIAADTEKAKKDNMENNTILKALR